MAELEVIRHEVRRHQPFLNEEYDPGQDMLIVFHRNPSDPDDPTEFGHHIHLQGVAYRKEMWGLQDYAETIDMELRDLARYYVRKEDELLGDHPLADITQHYFETPPVRMKSFAPAYVMDRVTTAAIAPTTPDGAMRMCRDVVMSGIEDVKKCLASSSRRRFPCKGMTGLSSDSVNVRTKVMGRMGEQTERLKLKSCRPLDDVRQLLTDRESELEQARDAFVNHALNESNTPEIMRQRVVDTAVRRGLLKEGIWS